MRKALERGWKVAGAVRSGDDIHHIYTDSPEEAARTRNSKYAECRAEHVYRLIKEDLAAGKKVLFTGTPCLVAGLLAVTGEHPNLVTVDMACAGWTSMELIKGYLKDIGAVDYIFRDPDGGGSSGMAVMSDGSLVLDHRHRGPGIAGSASLMLGLRPSCHGCPYRDTKHAADITVGDWWGRYRYGKDLLSNPAVSVALFNTQKAMELYKQCSWKVDRKITTEQAIADNAFRQLPPINDRQHKFLDDAVSSGHSQARLLASPIKDLWIDAVHYNNNYGSVILSYAMTEYLRRLGLRCCISCDPRTQFPAADYAKELYVEASWEDRHKHAKANILSGDQFLNWSLFRNYPEITWYTRVDKSMPCIGFGLSTGTANGNYPANPKELATFMANFKRYAALGIRETPGVDLFRKHGISADFTFDTVNLLEPADYEALMPTKPVVDGEYILVYCTPWVPSHYGHLMRAAHRIALRDGLKIVFIGNYDSGVELEDLSNRQVALRRRWMPEEWLWLIRNASLVLTSSYHGTLFSLMFGKRFAGLNVGGERSVRIQELETRFGIRGKVSMTGEGLDRLLSVPYDAVKVAGLLSDLRYDARAWLNSKLRGIL